MNTVYVLAVQILVVFTKGKDHAQHSLSIYQVLFLWCSDIFFQFPHQETFHVVTSQAMISCQLQCWTLVCDVFDPN